MKQLQVQWLKGGSVERHKESWKKLSPAVNLYKSVGKRNAYLFDWLLYMWENLCLSCADKKYVDELALIKTKVAILDTLWDDVADSSSEEDSILLKEIEKILNGRQYIDRTRITKEQEEYLDKTIQLYDEIMADIIKLPRFNDFKKILDWDFRQLSNSMHYAHLVNTFPLADNVLENRIYGHHSMTVMICGTIDLMASPEFNVNDLHNVRKILYIAQEMARIGNMVNTYPREAAENDISSEVATIALEKRLIQQNTETKQKLKVLTRLLPEFYKIWKEKYNELEAMGKKIKSIDMKEFLRERKFIQDMYESRVAYWNRDYSDKKFIE